MFLLKGSKDRKKLGKVELNLTERLAFKRLLYAFKIAPLLIYFDLLKKIWLETDTLNRAIVGILS